MNENCLNKFKEFTQFTNYGKIKYSFAMKYFKQNELTRMIIGIVKEALSQI